MNDTAVIALAFIAYMLIVGYLGILAFGHTHNVQAFLLAERRLPYWVTALSAGASDMSGWLLLGLPGLAYVSTTESAWVAVGLLVGTYLNWRFIARPLREQTEHFGESLTIPEFFEHRFGDDTHILRSVSAIFILVFFVFYTAAGFVAGGKLFAASVDLPYGYAVVLSAALVVVYTAVGGFLAVAWTDALQASLMFIALVVVAGLALAQPAAPEFASNMLDATSNPHDQALTAIVIVSSLAWGCGYFGQPHILARFMAIRHGTEITAARRLGVGWTGITLCAAVIIGYAGKTVLGAETLNGDSERVFLALIELFLHPALAGVCLAAVLAAIMSTADSQLLIAAAALTHDLLPSLGRTQPVSLHWHRAIVVLICVVAASMALRPDAMVFDMVAYAWAGFGATIGPCVIMSLYAPRTTKWSILAGMFAGAISVAVWENTDGAIFDIYALLPGFVAGIVTIAGVNRLIVLPPRAGG